MTTKGYRKQLADNFLHVLEERQLDWKKEWHGISQLPVNGYSGYRYRGINRFFLMLVSLDRKYNDPRWCTYNQIASKKWKLKNAKGQGVKVEYWFPYDTQEKKSLTWQEFRDKEGDFSESRYVLRAVYKTVFNASLIEGIPEPPRFVNEEIKPDTLVNTLSQNMNVEIINDGGDRAYYSTAEDKIHMPLPGTFHSQYGYDSSALHELAHSTGAEHRLNRPLQNTFGTEAYAYEELIAEISSCFFSANISIVQDENHIENHKAYVQSWINAIKEKPETLIRAVQQAEKVTSYMEYKADLIEKAEYEKVVSSTAEEKVKEKRETAIESAADIEQGLSQIEGRIQKVEKIINYIDEKLETKEQKTGIKKDYDVVPKSGTKSSIPIKL